MCSFACAKSVPACAHARCFAPATPAGHCPPKGTLLALFGLQEKQLLTRVYCSVLVDHSLPGARHCAASRPECGGELSYLARRSQVFALRRRNDAAAGVLAQQGVYVVSHIRAAPPLVSRLRMDGHHA